MASIAYGIAGNIISACTSPITLAATLRTDVAMRIRRMMAIEVRIATTEIKVIRMATPLT